VHVATFKSYLLWEWKNWLCHSATYE